jgi:hypothetical protein
MGAKHPKHCTNVALVQHGQGEQRRHFLKVHQEVSSTTNKLLSKTMNSTMLCLALFI